VFTGAGGQIGPVDWIRLGSFTRITSSSSFSTPTPTPTPSSKQLLPLILPTLTVTPTVVMIIHIPGTQPRVAVSCKTCYCTDAGQEPRNRFIGSWAGAAVGVLETGAGLVFINYKAALCRMSKD
jgi:hypothetical protein